MKTDCLIFWLSSLFTKMVRYSVRRTSDAAPICLSISHSILPSLVNKTPRYLNSSVWGSDSSLTWREQSTFSYSAPWSQTWRC
ncbi:hypothetical protein LDENG_00229360 [Lucifuga dentata]|nr:hypothetical protein LDENG_00229360 [Lucifuga dentata]